MAADMWHELIQWQGPLCEYCNRCHNRVRLVGLNRSICGLGHYLYVSTRVHGR